MRNYTAKVELDTGIGTLTSYTGLNQRKSQLNFDFNASKQVSTHAVNTWDRNTGKTFQQAFDYVIDAVDRRNLIIGAGHDPRGSGKVPLGAGLGSVLGQPQHPTLCGFRLS